MQLSVSKQTLFKKFKLLKFDQLYINTNTVYKVEVIKMLATLHTVCKLQYEG